MNINDIKSSIESSADRLEAIFEKQLELIHKYHPIEKANGMLLDSKIPVDINTVHGQCRLKDFMWRITEELGEYTAAANIDHQHEEIADALHFFIELFILSGISAKSLVTDTMIDNLQDTNDLFCERPVDRLEAQFQVSSILIPLCTHGVWDSVAYLALAGNTLKQKPWKITHMLTDTVIYERNIVKAFDFFIAHCIKNLMLTPDNLYDLYFRKNKINQFRIKSKY